MARIPEPRHTPDGPTYEGRPLDRVDDEVVDQGLSFDLGTLVGRRGILGLVGLGAGAAVLSACSAVSGSTATATATPSPSATATPTPTASATTPAVTVPSGEIPDETAGPYPGDGSNGPDVLETSGIVRSDIRTSIGSDTVVAGVPLEVILTILDMASGDVPFAGVAVYAWQCDAAGRYSMYSSGVESETFLRGVQTADANGQVTFSSIVPACYTGRWPHIHFEVYPDVAATSDSTQAIAVSQIAIPAEVLGDVYAREEYAGSPENLSQVSLDTDNVFGEDGGALQLATMTGSVDAGFAAALVARVDTSTEPAGGDAPGAPPA
ncbi:3,4-dioxygenase subunit beta [Microbacterium excoecariae]|uniref:dioxygenase family protein n=1 Tax=Microbacterium excoecariae TaxID=2715210 RepID=UPI00140E73A5|nr:3,4-dioxygenase subunit beta [Microbacterium excoecariae]NHI17529.1 3,4-dioxygenase subunit beta [Microbacterium excoecariae]